MVLMVQRDRRGEFVESRCAETECWRGSINTEPWATNLHGVRQRPRRPVYRAARFRSFGQAFYRATQPPRMVSQNL